VEATINTEIQDFDELRSLLEVYVIYVEAVVNTSGKTVPFAQETTALCAIFAVPPQWQLFSNHCKCAIDILFSSRSWEFS
jgi:hypothetical protein